MVEFNKMTIIKLIELVLAIVIFALHYNTFEENKHIRLVISSTAYLGYLIIVIGTFLGQVTGKPVGKTVDLFFSIVGAIIFIVSGALSIDHFQGWAFHSSVTDEGIAKGSLAIILGVLFIVDGFFTFKEGN